MPILMDKRKIRKYKKKLAKGIYNDALAKEKAKLLREQRRNKIEEIKLKAREDARISMQSGGRIKQGLGRMQQGMAKFNQKRLEIAKKVEPYYNNLNQQFTMGFDPNDPFGLKKKKK